MKARERQGFTLLELSIVLVIIALVTGMAIQSGISVVETARLTSTQKKMKAIDDALMQYRIASDRLPCPGDLSLTQGSANYGLEAGAGTGSAIGTGTGVCTGTGMLPAADFTGAGATNIFATAAEGAVPAVTLGLSPDVMVDGWGNQFRYAVDISYTANAAFTSTPIGCTNGALTMNDSNGNARSTGSIYVLISHGANGHGAYTRNGVIQSAGSVNANELTNCHCNSSGVATAYAPTYVQMQHTQDPNNALDNFDDLVTFKERWQIQTQWDKVGGCTVIYVTDSGNNRVQKFDMSGTYISQFGMSGSGNGQFSGPAYIHLDANGNFWVGDKSNERIQKFDSKFGFLLSVGGGWCDPPCNGSFYNPHAATIDAGGNIWAVDSGWNRVQEYNSGGAWQNTYGQSDVAGDSSSAAGQFNGPEDIALDADGNFYVADYYNSRVEKFNSSGVWQSSITANLSRPSGLAFDSGGNLWVTDCWYSIVLKYDRGGNYVTQFATKGSGDGQLDCPLGIAIDASGNFWIADYNNNRIQEFSSSGVYQRHFGTPGSGNGQFSGPYGIAVSGR